MSDDSVVRVAQHGRVVEVTLDRPKANAIDASTSRVMGEVFQRFRDDPDVVTLAIQTPFQTFETNTQSNDATAAQ